MMNRRHAVVIGVIGSLGSACSARGQMGRPSFGITVYDDLLPGSQTKYGIDAFSDSGIRLFGSASLAGGGAASSYAGAGLPKWVRVTWREGDFIQRYDPINKSAWTGGKIVGDYKIEVASRIPQDVQTYASQGKGRAIYLQFRIHDEGVLLAWAVEESLPGGGGRRYSMHGGDFKRRQTDANGKVTEKGWYIHPKTGQRIETDF